jgi:hypothetical protein
MIKFASDTGFLQPVVIRLGWIGMGSPGHGDLGDQ